MSSNLTIDIACPSCNHSFVYPVASMRPGTTTACPSCNVTIEFEGDDGREVQRALDDFVDTLERIRL